MLYKFRVDFLFFHSTAGLVLLLLAMALASPSLAETPPGEKETPAVEEKREVRKTFEALSEASAKCASCHEEDNHGLYQQWGRSKHYGANVGCYECHQADKDDADAFRHKGVLIATLVTPKDCGRCHEKETKEFVNSRHAHAGAIEGREEYHLGRMVQGLAGEDGGDAALQGCWQCHGAKVEPSSSGKLKDAATWPNAGIGRINPDGSKGACSACHQRHEFSLVQARRPETCGKCHRGPDHPQAEIYASSKHGVNFLANHHRNNLDRPKWIPGEDYDSGPTCATCHMSATTTLPLTHDSSARVGWNLKNPVSKKVEEADGKKAKDRRKDMQDVCMSCHSKRLVDNFYRQYDSVVHLYNVKFAKPGLKLMTLLRKNGLLTEVDLDEPIEWTWRDLWRQAGRRMRQGAAMMAANYTQTEGLAEVAKLFYARLIPEARELAKNAARSGDGKAAKKVNDHIDALLSRPEHQWFKEAGR